MAEKKQVPLRISKELFDELSRWAEDDFRSLNGQIEYLLLTVSEKEGRKSSAKITKKMQVTKRLHLFISTKKKRDSCHIH